jgi:hypothetical protein
MNANAFLNQTNTRAREAWGLIGAGSTKGSYLSHMPSVLSRLGPVKASSFQVARRLANSLRAGFAVSHYSALEYCPWIWIYQPEHSLDRIARDLAAQMPIHDTRIVLCECSRESSSFGPLRGAGARVATLNLVEPSRGRLFVAEGHSDALRVLNQLLVCEQRKLIQMPPAAKRLYFAGIHLAKYLPLPAIAASVESLRCAGFPRAQAAQVTGALVTRAAAAYDKAGRKAWNPGAESELRTSLESNAERLDQLDPRMAAVFSEGIRTALGYFGEAGSRLPRSGKVLADEDADCCPAARPTPY